METTKHDDTFILVKGHFGFYVVLPKFSTNYDEVLASGAHEEMKALQKLMNAAHENEHVQTN